MRRWASRTLSKPEREAIAERMSAPAVVGLFYRGYVVGVMVAKEHIAGDLAELMNAVEALEDATRKPPNAGTEDARHSLGMARTVDAERYASPGTPYLIAVGDRMVIERKVNGQHRYMGYRSERGAVRALARVRPEMPEATIVYTYTPPEEPQPVRPSPNESGA